MYTQIIFKDIDFLKYLIDENLNIKKENEIINIEDIIYHSTNGYDYILLENYYGEYKLYPMDKVIYNSFYPETQNMFQHFKIIHLDGNLKNNNIDNLKMEEEKEEWREVIYPGIEKGLYMISSFGNLINIKSNNIINGSISKKYINDSLMNKDRTCKYPLRHQLVALAFIPNPNPEAFKCINHINGDRKDNSISNLEWVDYKINNHHAIFCGLSPHKSNITTKDIDMVIEMLLDSKYSHNPSIIYENLDHDKFPFITKAIIQNIKRKEKPYIRSDSKYDLENIKFNKAGLKAKDIKITNDEFDMIIEMLMDPKYHGYPTLVFKNIDHDKHPNITLRLISLIKQKKMSFNHSNKYNIDDIIFNDAEVSTTDIDMIIEMLLNPKYDSRPYLIYNDIDHTRYPYISLNIIIHIKGKHPAYIRSDSKYDLKNLEFKSHRNKYT